jgi:hypothetical protein
MWTSSVFAQDPTRVFVSGNHMYDVCNRPSGSREKDWCAGLAAGMTDALQGESEVCVPTPVTVGQVVDVIMKYLRAHPDRRHLSAWSLTRAALQSAFPCK